MATRGRGAMAANCEEESRKTTTTKDTAKEAG